MLHFVNSRVGQLWKERGDLIRAALHDSVTIDEWLPYVVAEINRLPADVHPASVLQAMLHLARLGLTPGDTQQEAWITAQKSKGIRTACVLIGYQGWVLLAARSGVLRDYTVEVVLEGEECEHVVTEEGPRFRHRIPMPRDIRDEAIIAAYCQYHLTNGGKGIVVVYRDELDERRRNAGTASPWHTHFAAMARKTAIATAMKRLPRFVKSRILAYAAAVDESPIDAAQTELHGTTRVVQWEDFGGNGKQAEESAKTGGPEVAAAPANT